MTTPTPSNEAIAEALDRVANRLAEREANPHRVQAYRTAAETARSEKEPLALRLADGGLEALKTLPGIGDSLASRIAGFIQTGRLVLLEQLNAAFSPTALFARVPGLGPELAHRIYDTLKIETLEALEVAAYDGRLAQVEGIGRRRLRALRAQLNAMLSRQSHRRARRFVARQPGHTPNEEDIPTVAMLLSVDREYRHRSAFHELPRIAPRRFNPSGAAWLPILNTHRKPWACTALFSNTARAHELEKTNDWVVLYVERPDGSYQYTVVTETRGDLKGKRVVRGREAECRAYYHDRHRQAA